jgi:hypothetical protein
VTQRIETKRKVAHDEAERHPSVDKGFSFVFSAPVGKPGKSNHWYRHSLQKDWLSEIGTADEARLHKAAHDEAVKSRHCKTVTRALFCGFMADICLPIDFNSCVWLLRVNVVVFGVSDRKCHGAGRRRNDSSVRC